MISSSAGTEGQGLTGDTESDVRLLLVGRGGLWEGLRKIVRPGASVTIGRSRGCDVSLRRAPGFVDHPDPTTVFHSEMFRKVSRVHCEVELREVGSVLLRDLSRNGLLVGGERVTDTYTLSPSSTGVTLQVGDASVGVIELVSKRA